MANTLKSALSVVFGIIVLAGPLSGTSATAGAIPEVSASRVIQLAPPESGEKLPVVSGVAIDPAGKLLAVVGDDHLVRIFDAQTGALVHRMRSHSDWIKVSAFRPDGQTLATAGADGRIRLWDVAAALPEKGTGPIYRHGPEGASHKLDLSPFPATSLYTLAYSRDGQMLAAAGFSDKVWVFDGQLGSAARELAAPGSDIRAIAFSPDGTRLAAAGRAGVVRIWDIRSGQPVIDVPASTRRICALCYSPDGKLLAAAGQQRIVRLLSAASGSVLADLPQRPGTVMALCFCGPRTLASAGSDNVIHLWDVSTGQEQRRLVGHTGSVTTLVLDGHTGTLISGSYDTTVRLWDLKDRESNQHGG
jgi:WD40 repeat protein